MAARLSVAGAQFLCAYDEPDIDKRIGRTVRRAQV
jgi:hypothetical protein